MSFFHFDGRSRQRAVTFARDHAPSRGAILQQAEARRKEREEREQQTERVKKIQRLIRYRAAVRVLDRLATQRLRECLATLGVGMDVLTKWSAVVASTAWLSVIQLPDDNGSYRTDAAASGDDEEATTATVVKDVTQFFWCFCYLSRRWRDLEGHQRSITTVNSNSNIIRATSSSNNSNHRGAGNWSYRPGAKPASTSSPSAFTAPPLQDVDNIRLTLQLCVSPMLHLFRRFLLPCTTQQALLPPATAAPASPSSITLLWLVKRFGPRCLTNMANGAVLTLRSCGDVSSRVFKEACSLLHIVVQIVTLAMHEPQPADPMILELITEIHAVLLLTLQVRRAPPLFDLLHFLTPTFTAAYGQLKAIEEEAVTAASKEGCSSRGNNNNNNIGSSSGSLGVRASSRTQLWDRVCWEWMGLPQESLPCAADPLELMVASPFPAVPHLSITEQVSLTTIIMTAVADRQEEQRVGGDDGVASAAAAAAGAASHAWWLLAHLSTFIPFSLQLTAMAPPFPTLGFSSSSAGQQPDEELGGGASTRRGSAESFIARRSLVLRLWASCASRLMSYLSHTRHFIDTIVKELHTEHRRAAAAAEDDDEGSYETGASFYECWSPSHCVANWFSPSGGFRLLQHVMGDDFIDGPVASSLKAPLPRPAAGCEGVQQLRRRRRDELSRHATLNVICEVFTWPLFRLGTCTDAEYTRVTNVVLAHLISSPQNLKKLWLCFREHTTGLWRIFHDIEVMAMLRSPPADTRLLLQNPRDVEEEEEEEEASSPNQDGRPPGPSLRGTALRSSIRWIRVAAGQQTPSELLVGVPRCSMGSASALFYDPHASFSILVFTILRFYVEASNVEEDVRREAVWTMEDVSGLVLYLRDIVFRAHAYGVLPHTHSEEVAQLAMELLTKLHVLDEALGLVQNPAVWVVDDREPAVQEMKRSFVPRGSFFDDDSDNDDNRNEEVSDHGEAYDVDGVNDDDADEGDGERSVWRMKDGLPLASTQFCSSYAWSRERRFRRLLLRVPFIIPFYLRTAVMRVCLAEMDNAWAPPLFSDPLGAGMVMIRRDHVFQDAYSRFAHKPNTVEMRHVRFVNSFGELEAGFGGGVYRELLVLTCQEGFAAEHGLFCQTVDGSLYPNALSYIATGDEHHLRQLRFVGSMVGRAIRDGIVQDVPLSQPFINALLGRRNTFTNLKAFDSELYAQLLALMHLSQEEVEGLCLTFTVSVEELGVMKETELIPNGRNTSVTKQHVPYYIHLVTDFKLNRQAAAQINAFRTGLSSVISPAILQLFDCHETTKLICGNDGGRIDVEDWKRNTTYRNEADATHPTVQLFWDVVESLSPELQSLLLQFTTSMRHPPLLGFRFLSPPFHIQLTDSNVDRLPSAATCFSTIKMPRYTSFDQMRGKIVAAIKEGSTFELS